MQINKTSIDLEDLMNRNVERFAPLLEAEGQTVRISFDPHSKTVFSDETLVERIFLNMLSNAIQHSAKGGEIRVIGTPAQDQTGISISVRDFGEGISKEYQDRIFEKFSQVGLRREGQKTGTGLGLAFCRMAAEALGGAISVESEPGKGSCFTLLLPEALPSE
jgi:signal transduction histidine kinase